MRVIFTCGGSAGHVNPALSVAKQFETHHPGCEILFVGAVGGMEERLVTQAGYPIRTVHVSTFERGFSWKILKHDLRSAVMVPVGQHEAAAILDEFRPDLVVGTGGYASFPAVREAARRHIPTAIHESNAFPGLTTRTLAGRVDLVMVGFPEAAAYYDGVAKRVAVTGTPVREEFFSLTRQQARLELGLSDTQPLVISFWGSLGAGHMSKRTVDLIERWVNEGRRFHYIHSAGRDIDEMPDDLKNRGIQVTDEEVRAYIDDMPRVMAAADLVLCGGLHHRGTDGAGQAGHPGAVPLCHREPPVQERQGAGRPGGRGPHRGGGLHRRQAVRHHYGAAGRRVPPGGHEPRHEGAGRPQRRRGHLQRIDEDFKLIVNKAAGPATGACGFARFRV